jgi:ferredoxin
MRDFYQAAPAGRALAATLSVTLDGATAELPWPAGTRMLDVLIAAGLDAPFSCRQGICGACACQLTGGEVEMAHNEVLEPADLADGYILACQAMALTSQVSITYLSHRKLRWRPIRAKHGAAVTTRGRPCH